MHKAEAISFHGPCEMILQEDSIMVRSRVNSKKLHQQQFQWNISHVKKFLAISDKHQLVIQVGRLVALIYVFEYDIQPKDKCFV